VGRCKHHLGSTPNHKKRAIVLEAQQRMVKLGAPVELPPIDALLAMLSIASGHVRWLRAEIAELESLSGEEAPALLSLYAEERDRVARVAKACLDAGVAERQVKLAEQYGEALAAVLAAIFDDPDLSLAEDRRRALPSVVRRHLLTFEGERSASDPLGSARTSS
jgi:hypothetical protein